jgi:hypothetical protein
MVWFFTRGSEELKLQTEREEATGEYVLTWGHPDGTTKTERFSNGDAFKRRLEEVEAYLATQAWTRRDPPMLLTDGWKI